MSLLGSRTVTLDANGAASVQTPPVPTWEIWDIDRLVVSTIGGNDTQIPTVYVYDGSEAGGVIFDTTYTGNQDSAEYNTPQLLQPGQYLTVVWGRGPNGNPGTPGEIATVQIYGTNRPVR